MSSNPLDNLDFTTPEFRAGVEALAGSLKVPKGSMFEENNLYLLDNQTSRPSCDIAGNLQIGSYKAKSKSHAKSIKCGATGISLVEKNQLLHFHN